MLIFIGRSQVSEEHEVCKETQQEGAEEDAGQQCQAGCSKEKGLTWFKTENQFSYWHACYSIFIKIKLGVTKSSPPEFEESPPEAWFELYFRCQLCIRPVCSDQCVCLFPGRSSRSELWRGFVLILAASIHKVKRLLPPQCCSAAIVGTGQERSVVQSLFSSSEMVIE